MKSRNNRFSFCNKIFVIIQICLGCISVSELIATQMLLHNFKCWKMEPVMSLSKRQMCRYRGEMKLKGKSVL